MFISSVVRNALVDSFRKFDVRYQIKNPVMFCVYVGAFIVSFSLFSNGTEVWFQFCIALWLWLTVYFANFSESLAEGRGKAQADSLKSARKDAHAHVVSKPDFSAPHRVTSSSLLVKGDLVIVKAGEVIPGDGEILLGAASIDESAITGESAPVIREAGGDRSSVTAGTTLLSDMIIFQITKNQGETFLDQMISMVEGAKRQKTPNELALSILLSSMTIIFLFVCLSIKYISDFSIKTGGVDSPVSGTIVIALFVCLIPTTIGGLLSAIGISGMSRLAKKNVIAMSGRAVEAAGDIDVLLLDKTGTITYGNRFAREFHVAEGVSQDDFIRSIYVSSVADETPEGRSILKLLREKYTFSIGDGELADGTEIKFSADTRMSGYDLKGISYRKGATDAIRKLVNEIDSNILSVVTRIAQEGGTPLVVLKNTNIQGVIELRDVVKQGIKERFSDLRAMGIKTVMITGDNPLTAAAIAAEAGVDEFLAEATPKSKLDLIKKYQSGGRLVAMTGDGTNDAPALAQADVAVAMNSGTQAAKEAANMVDLDSDPTKLIEVVEVGKQLLMTRGALTTFSIANDISKYFAIIPAAFVGIYPCLGVLNIMNLKSPQSAVLSAVIFNAIIIVFLIPLALRGVKFKALSAERILQQNALVYGLGGVLFPFLAIKIIDNVLVMFSVI